MSDTVMVAIIGAVSAFLTAALTVVFVSRRTAKAEAVHRQAETVRLEDEISERILNRAKNQIDALLSDNTRLEDVRRALSTQIENLQIQIRSLTRSVETQREQIAILIEQSESKDRTIRRMQEEIEQLQRENESLRQKVENLQLENNMLRTRPIGGQDE